MLPCGTIFKKVMYRKPVLVKVQTHSDIHTYIHSDSTWGNQNNIGLTLPCDDEAKTVILGWLKLALEVFHTKNLLDKRLHGYMWEALMISYIRFPKCSCDREGAKREEEGGWWWQRAQCGTMGRSVTALPPNPPTLPPLHNQEQRAHAAEQSFLGVFKRREHHQRVRVKYH